MGHDRPAQRRQRPGTLAAARHVGVVPMGIAGLSAFKSVKRRMEKVAEVQGITIYDDFAHHPTPSPPPSTACASASARHR
jgi:hypothetical protein